MGSGTAPFFWSDWLLTIFEDEDIKHVTTEERLQRQRRQNPARAAW
jgi:hypothetical protein